MKKTLIAVLAFGLFTGSVAGAQDVNVNIDLDLGLSDLFSSEEENESEENNTYGERVGGQSVHTEETPSKAEVGRDSQDFQITEDTSQEEKGFFARFIEGLRGLL